MGRVESLRFLIIYTINDYNNTMGHVDISDQHETHIVSIIVSVIISGGGRYFFGHWVACLSMQTSFTLLSISLR